MLCETRTGNACDLVTVTPFNNDLEALHADFKNPGEKSIFRGKGKEAKIMEIFDEKAIRQAKAEDGPPVSAAAIHAALLESDSIFRAALDWITELCNFVYFYYMCTYCMKCPSTGGAW